MPLVRCRNYDDNGNLINERADCLRQACEFVHPSDAFWHNAPRKGIWTIGGRGRGQGSTRGRVPPRGGAGVARDTSGSSSWGGSPTAPRRNSFNKTQAGDGWDNGNVGTGWAPVQPTTEISAADKTIAWDTTDKSASWGGWVPPASREKAMIWGVSENKIAISGTKDNGEGKSGWPVSADGKDSDWGASASLQSNGWDISGTHSNDGQSEATSTWGTSKDKSSSSWGASSVQLAGDWGAATGKTPSPSKPFSGWDSPAAANWSISSDGEPAGPITLSPKAVYSSVIPEPILTTVKSRTEGAARSISVDTNDINISKTFSLRSSTPTYEDAKYNDPIGLWRAVVRHSARAVRLQVELKTLHESLEQWKATQSSPQYTQVGVAARMRLSEVRKRLERHSADIKSRYDHALSELTRLPDLFPEQPGIVVEEPQLQRYSQELKRYFEDLRKTLISITTIHSQGIDAPVEMYEEGELPGSPPKKRRRSSPLAATTLISDSDDLQLKIDSYEDWLSETLDQVYDADSLKDVLDQNIAAFRHGITEDGELGDSRSPLYRVQVLEGQTGKLRADIGALAQPVAAVIGDMQRHQGELAELRVDHTKTHKWTIQLLDQLEEMEQSRRRDQEQLRQLNEQIQMLHTFPRPSPRPKPTPQMNFHIDAIIANLIQEDINPVLRAIHEEAANAVQEWSKMMYSDSVKSLEPVVTLLGYVCTWADSRLQK